MPHTIPAKFFPTQPAWRTHQAKHSFLSQMHAFATPCIARMALLILAALCALGIALSTSTPTKAYAKSYDMPYVTIEANVQSDGSLQVTERRAFDFNGSFSAIWWDLSNLPEDSELSIQDVSVASATDDTVKSITRAATADEQALFEPLKKVSFDLSWRESGGPDTPSYSVDQAKNTVYVFYDSEDVTNVFQITYTITNAATPYKDVADLYWKYIGTSWAEDSENVECTIKLPNPTDVTAVPGTNVYAWGHGPLSGKLAFDDTGTRVTYSVDRVPAGSFAEAHVLFPTNWLSDVTDKIRQKNGDTLHLDSVLAEEKTWADQANYKRMYSLIFIGVWVVISLIVILWAIWYFLRHGREYRPDFQDSYWRDEPDAGVHPAVIDRLWRFNNHSNTILTTGILHLVNRGVLALSYEQSEKPSGFFGKKTTQTDYILTRQKTDKPLHPIDKQTIDLLFDVFAEGADSINIADLNQYAKAHPKAAQQALSRWQGVLTTEVNKQEYFENTTKHAMYLLLVAIGLGIGALATSVLSDNFISLLCVVPAIIVLLVLMTFMGRRTRKGVEVYARAKALKSWLTDFTAIGERPILDIHVWGTFMVYAHIFGVTKELKDQLIDTYPEIFDTTDPVSFPLMWWYLPHTGMGDFGDTFETALANTWLNTEVTLNEALAALEGNSSSGGGFGGGFSMGGGGGFGGGGGGAR